MAVQDTGVPLSNEFKSCGKKFNLMQFYYSGKNSLTVVRTSFPPQWPSGWVMRNGLAVQKLKVDKYLYQIRLKSLKVVQFECPRHCNRSYCTILKVKDLSLEDNSQS